MTPFFDVRTRGFRDRTEVPAAVALLEARIRPLAAESVPLSAAAGRVSAGPVVSRVDVPGFVRAAMDGYAVRASDTFGADADNPLSLTLVGESMPGVAYGGTVAAGTAVRVMTGAPLPAGADAVLVAESAEERGKTVFAKEAVTPGRNVGRIGEDVAAGREILPAGRRLRPQDLGLLAAVGEGSIRVVRQPRVTILVTGNELLPPGAKPAGVRIVDCNSPMLAALAARDGGVCERAAYLKDDYTAVKSAIRDAAGDVVLVSGGSSVGTEDHAPRAVAELGELAVHGVALRPASPTGIGFVGTKTVFLLPGNPVSCLCAYDLFAGRAIRRLGGRNSELPYRTGSFPVGSKIVSAVGRVDYVRVRIVGGKLEPVAVSGASILSTTVVADGFVLVPGECEGYGPGEILDVFLYDEDVSVEPPR
ncbi:MAG TPA: gephyrin-like molybdotransferase Glp [Fimbriiglobus sp.]|jgi:molybdopterin molybdotransferase